MNITLIGMAGAGKSTIGKILAKKYGFNFIDIDEYIMKESGMSLQELVDLKGEHALLEAEERIVTDLELHEDTIISPGGSIVYSKKAMTHLKEVSVIVYLDVPFKVLINRVPDLSSRGLVGLGDSSLKQIYNERQNLYEKYADIHLKIKRKDSRNTIVNMIIEQLSLS